MPKVTLRGINRLNEVSVGENYSSRYLFQGENGLQYTEDFNSGTLKQFSSNISEFKKNTSISNKTYNNGYDVPLYAIEANQQKYHLNGRIGENDIAVLTHKCFTNINNNNYGYAFDTKVQKPGQYPGFTAKDAFLGNMHGKLEYALGNHDNLRLQNIQIDEDNQKIIISLFEDDANIPSKTVEALKEDLLPPYFYILRNNPDDVSVKTNISFFDNRENDSTIPTPYLLVRQDCDITTSLEFYKANMEKLSVEADAKYIYTGSISNFFNNNHGLRVTNSGIENIELNDGYVGVQFDEIDKQEYSLTNSAETYPLYMGSNYLGLGQVKSGDPEGDGTDSIVTIPHQPLCGFNGYYGNYLYGNLEVLTTDFNIGVFTYNNNIKVVTSNPTGNLSKANRHYCRIYNTTDCGFPESEDNPIKLSTGDSDKYLDDGEGALSTYPVNQSINNILEELLNRDYHAYNTTGCGTESYLLFPSYEMRNGQQSTPIRGCFIYENYSYGGDLHVNNISMGLDEDGDYKIYGDGLAHAGEHYSLTFLQSIQDSPTIQVHGTTYTNPPLLTEVIDIAGHKKIRDN